MNKLIILNGDVVIKEVALGGLIKVKMEVTNDVLITCYIYQDDVLILQISDLKNIMLRVQRYNNNLSANMLINGTDRLNIYNNAELASIEMSMIKRKPVAAVGTDYSDLIRIDLDNVFESIVSYYSY